MKKNRGTSPIAAWRGGVKTMVPAVRSRRRAGLLLTVLILFFYSGTSGAAADASDNGEVKPKLIYETAGEARISWCGNEGLVVDRDGGIEWISTITSNKLMIAVNDPPRKYATEYVSKYSAYNCSPDGKWLVYSDMNSVRVSSSYKVEPCNELDCHSDWDGGIVDLWRHEIATGFRHKFAVVPLLGYYDVMGPVGYRVLLGGQHLDSMKMSEPRWGVYRPKDKWLVSSGVSWFRDGSGYVWDDTQGRIRVEIFGKNGWIKSFYNPKYREISRLSTGEATQIVFTGNHQKERNVLYGCRASQSRLNCTALLKESTRISSSEILPSGDIAYTKADGDCVFLYSSNGKRSCMASIGDGKAQVSIIGMSPDGKRLAVVLLEYKKRSKECVNSCGLVVAKTQLFLINPGK